MSPEQTTTAESTLTLGEQLIALLQHEYRCLRDGALNEALSIAKEKTDLSRVFEELQNPDKQADRARLKVLAETIQREARRNQELWDAVMAGLQQAKRLIGSVSADQGEIHTYTDGLCSKRVRPESVKRGRYA